MRIELAVGLVLLSACTPYVLSPAGRTFPMETSKALNPRETGIQVEGAGGLGGYIVLAGFTARIRHGLVKQLDGSIEGGYQRIRLQDPDVGLGNRNLFNVRLGIKYEIVEPLAFTVGLAGGGWAGGGFISPDASLILAWENPYCVPYVDLGGYTSHPVRANTVVLVDAGPTLEGDFVAVPTFTYGWTTAFGLRIPLSREPDRRTKSALLLGIRFRGATFDNEPQGYRDHRTYFHGAGAFEYVFGPKSAK